MNEVRLKGTIFRQPKIMITKNGYSYVKFLLKVDRSAKGYDNIPCMAWSANAETISKLPDGAAITVEDGHLEVSSYEKDGVKQWKMEVVVTKFAHSVSSFEDMGAFE